MKSYGYRIELKLNLEMKFASYFRDDDVCLLPQFERMKAGPEKKRISYSFCQSLALKALTGHEIQY